MSFLVRSAPKPLTLEQYGVAMKLLTEGGGVGPLPFPRRGVLPEGFEFHVAFYSDGEVEIAEIWHSQEQADAFAERLKWALGKAGVDPGEPEICKVQDMSAPSPRWAGRSPEVAGLSE
jgi:hypothetical protein